MQIGDELGEGTARWTRLWVVGGAEEQFVVVPLSKILVQYPSRVKEKLAVDMF